MEIVKKYFPYLICLIVGLAAGFWIAGKMIDPVTIEKPVIKTEYQTQTETKIVYVEKEQGETTDINANIGKNELEVKVNGQKAVIHKSDDEKFVFDKNKLELTQQSKATVNIEIPIIDKTKRWGLGAGFGNNGIGYAITFPVSKKNNNLDGWAYHDNDTTSAGVMVRF